MAIRLIAAGLLAGGVWTSSAQAQFSSSVPRPVKTSFSTATGITGGFLMGADDCAAAHTVVPAGSQADVPFTTGTTGAEGQNEANCYAFGTSGVTLDVWFDWQASATGNVTMVTCGGTGIDSKIAAYPFSAGCPADGTSLACNDDSCGLQSSISWAVVGGASYTLQVGTFPGGGGGGGTFDLTEQPTPPCGLYDDGTAENSLGLTAGGELGWLHNQGCFLTVDSIDTAYGSAAASVPDGNASRIVCYEDADCDLNPATGLSLMWSVATVVTNSGTNILNNNPRVGGTATAPSRCTWVMATASQLSGQFPGPMDQTIPTSNAWVVGMTAGAGGVMNIDDLNLNNVPPLQMQAIGFPAAWLLRANGTETGANPYPAQCFGTACLCGNNSDSGGCDNGLLGSGGAVLSGSGVASLLDDTLVLTVTNTPNQPGLFFQGNVFLDPPMPFGRGLLCCGTGIVRCGAFLPAGNTTNTETGNFIGGIFNHPPVSEITGNEGLLPGDVRCYQWWYRDPGIVACTSFNLSNSISVTWGT